jgi:UDP-N-acetylglucosamine--N-acetylmuramyl-(pentapeptide) pyrophosphoryl-undecaprenol N-acetylglucosamine transferase
MEADLVQKAGIPFQTIPAGQVAGMGLRTIPNLVNVVRGTLESRRILNAFTPDVLLFTGGYVAVPMAVAGRRLPGVVYVPDIEPGIAIKSMARYASIVALTHEDSAQYFPKTVQAIVTGYPTRPELKGWTRERGREHLGLKSDRFTLLVTGGSKGARSINRAVIANLTDLLQDAQIIHLTGKLDWEEVQSARALLPPELAEDYHPLFYLHEMGAALAAADLVVSRAGASALGEYPLFGLPSILVPYPHAWRYQKVNADTLARRGAAVRVEDDALSKEIVPAVRSLVRDPARLEAMRKSAQAMAQPQAAERLADIIRRLVEEKQHG